MKIIGWILVAVGVLNLIGFMYMMSTNSDRFYNNSEHFSGKLGGAITVGIIGGLLIYLSGDKNKPK